MIKILGTDCEEVLSEIGNIAEYAFKCFGSSDITSYAVLNDDNLISIILRNENRCVYLRNQKDKIVSYNFTVTDLNELDCLMYTDYDIYYRDGHYIYIDRNNGNQYNLSFVKIDGEPEGYDGYVSFIEYNQDKDIHLELQYKQMYREVNGKSHIYPYHLDHCEHVFFEEKFSKRKPLEFGPAINRDYYIRYDLDYDTVGYSQQRTKELLLTGEFEDSRNIVRYYKIKFITPGGNYMTMFPLGNSYKEEDIIKKIKDNGFIDSIPNIILETYNGNNEILEEVKYICEEISRVEKKNDDQYKLIMQIVNDNND